MSLNEPENKNKLQKYLDIINEEVMRGASLISDVRKLSEIEESEIPIQKTELCIILKESIESLKTSFQGYDINIQIDEFEKMIFLQANDLLKDVFGNILNNAVKYNENPSVEIFVKISRMQKEGQNYIKMEFIDNGIGISETQKELIFKRGHKEHKGGKGMGFGLTLVKKIVESYKGFIWVEDRVEGDYAKGSNFILLLPQGFPEK